MDTIKRINDIQGLSGETFRISVDGMSVEAAAGETVIAVLHAIGMQGFSADTHKQTTGGYCWMGICHSCAVKIDGRHNRRACQTLVRPGMQVDTGSNRFDEMGLQ